MPYKDQEKRRAYSREYHQKHGREYRQRNKLRLRQQKNAYYRANSFRYHGSEIVRKYGVSLAEYQYRLQEQNAKCAICRKPAETCSQRLAVDHNHRTGRVRGLLCTNCNRLLGNAKDSTDILYNAYCYMLVDEHVTITAALGTGASTMPDERDLD